MENLKILNLECTVQWWATSFERWGTANTRGGSIPLRSAWECRNDYMKIFNYKNRFINLSLFLIDYIKWLLKFPPLQRIVINIKKWWNEKPKF